MDQLRDYADSRLLNDCIYCGGPAETREHVPSRCLLEQPYPENLPVVRSCAKCNQGFSKDEEYFVCLIESALCGSTDPDRVRRPTVARILRNSPELRARIKSAGSVSDGQIQFATEGQRILNVMLKLARGHAAFELSQPCRSEPNHFWCGPMSALSDDQHDAFNEPHVQHLFGEVGSRGLQRAFVTRVTLQSTSGEQSVLPLIVNDWVDVQENLYRYLAIDDDGGLVIRIVVAEYLGCEVAWHLDAVEQVDETVPRAHSAEQST